MKTKEVDLDRMMFRLAGIEDAESISKLVNSAYRDEPSRKGWTTEADFLGGQRTDASAIAELLSKSDSAFVLCYDHQDLIGSVHLEKKSSRICYLGMFAVKPSLQNRGIGKKLLLQCEKQAKQKWGCSVMEMTVITIRTELIDWYIRNGYVLTGELRGFPYGDERFGIPLREDLELGVLEKKI